MKLLLLTVILSTPPSIFGAELHADTTLKIFSGLYTEKLSPPIFYDHYIPAILHYKTPKFNKTEVTFNNWYNCTSEKYPYSLSCPVVFHLNAAVSNLHVDFETIQPGMSDEKVSHWGHFEKVIQGSTFCHKIQAHFPSVYSNGDDVARYEEAVTNCNNQGAYVETNITDYVYNLRYPFSRMETNFYESFYRPVTALSANMTAQRLLASAVLSNSRTAVQAAVLGAFYAERNRWNFAASHCLANLLPPSVVTERKLKFVIQAVEAKMRNSSLAIPTRASISKYFSLPLADCTHTETDLVVRLLLPAIQTDRDELELYQIHPVLFNFDDKSTCQIKNVAARYIYDKTSQLAYESSCQSDELCLVETIGKVNLCVSMLLAHNFEGVLQHCQFECNIPTGPLAIMRVHRDKIVFFEKDPLKAQISCSTPEGTVQVGLAVQHRTYEVELGCNCSLEITNPKTMSVRTFKAPSAACSNDSMLNVTMLLPWHFVKNVDSNGEMTKILSHFDLDRILSVPTNEIELSEASKRVGVVGDVSEKGWNVTTWVLILIGMTLLGGQAYLYYQFKRLQVIAGCKDPVIYRRSGPTLIENEEEIM